MIRSRIGYRAAGLHGFAVPVVDPLVAFETWMQTRDLVYPVQRPILDQIEYHVRQDMARLTARGRLKS